VVASRFSTTAKTSRLTAMNSNAPIVLNYFSSGWGTEGGTAFG
jgi:hypothetical protein